MRDRQLYAKILGIEAPWTVTEVELDTEDASTSAAGSGQVVTGPSRVITMLRSW